MARRTLLAEAEIADRLKEIPRWSREGNAITRTWKFKDFPAALRLINQVGELAEATNWVSRPRMSAMAPKNSRREKRTAKVAPPGHPVPFTKPIVFWRSFIFGHPWARKMAPRARRPTSEARSGKVRRAIEYRRPLITRGRRSFQITTNGPAVKSTDRGALRCRTAGCPLDFSSSRRRPA